MIKIVVPTSQGFGENQMKQCVNTLRWTKNYKLSDSTDTWP